MIVVQTEEHAVPMSRGPFRVVLSADGKVQTWDPGAEEAFGIPPREAVGASFSRIVGMPAAVLASSMSSALRNRRSVQVQDVAVARGTLELWLLPVGEAGMLVVGHLMDAAEKARGDTRDAASQLQDANANLLSIREETRVVLQEVTAANAALVVAEKASSSAQDARENVTLYNRMLRHDVGNILTALGLRLALLRQKLRSAERTDEEIEAFTSLLARLEGVIAPAPGADARDLDVGLALTESAATVRLMEPDRSWVSHILLPPRALRARAVPGLEEAFLNLVQNAVLHNSGPHPEVWIEAASRDGSVEVTISDNGPGVPAAVLTKVLSKGRPSTDQPHGQGLAVAVDLIRKAGGTLRWTSRTPPTKGKRSSGSVFSIRLPAGV